MTIYFISGLGADTRIFKNLKLPDQYVIRYIHWLEPNASETLTEYCNRLSQQIDTSSDFSLIGLSFGGIIATELGKFLNPQNIIIISSVSNRRELPWYFRIVGKLNIHKIVPTWLFKKPTFIEYWFFSIRKEEEKKMLQQILKETSPNFLKWAIDKILKWNNIERQSKLFHIHGTKDRLLPLRYTNADIKIKGGGHLMVYSLADQISPVVISKLGYS